MSLHYPSIYDSLVVTVVRRFLVLAVFFVEVVFVFFVEVVFVLPRVAVVVFGRTLA